MGETEVFYMAFLPESTSRGSNLHSLLTHPAGLLLIKKRSYLVQHFALWP